jgi:gas vesicle protein
MQESNGYGAAVGWLLVGGALGACAALLLAPATGRRTRERLTRRLRDTKESVMDFTDDLASTTRDMAEKAGRIGDQAAKMAANASTAAREVVGSLTDRAERVARS